MKKMKEKVFKTLIVISVLALLSILVGCENSTAGKEFLTVDFHQNQSLRYKFISKREVEIDWGSSAKKSAGKKTSETMEMVISYRPVEINPYGLTKVKATCESIKVNKTGAKGKDAAESIVGKSFTFTVGPNGKVPDKSELYTLIRKAGEKSFRSGSKTGRIKNPDMIDDFITTQWFLWDAVSSIEKPAKGLKVGQSWKSKLLIPTSMVLRKARDVTYKLEEIRETETGRIAVISSAYSLSESVPRDWPIAYSGRFQLSGTFGFFMSMFKGIKAKEIQGQAEQLYNLDEGAIESYVQDYEVLMETGASPLGSEPPKIKITQHLEMRLLENEDRGLITEGRKE